MSGLLLPVNKKATAWLLSGILFLSHPYMVGAQGKTQINKKPDVAGARVTDVKAERISPAPAKKTKSHKKKRHVIINPSENDAKLKQIKEEKNKEKNLHP